MMARRQVFARVVGFATVLVLLSLCLPVVKVAAQDTWYAQYFANTELAGGPVLTRDDARLHFDWKLGSPGGRVPKDGFSARWTRTLSFTGGTYRFSFSSDDGIRIWVDDVLIVDDWRERQAGWSSVDHYISKGTHELRVEYFEIAGAALLQVNWRLVTEFAAWRGEYFDNTSLAGTPVLTRNDTAIDFDWGKGSPDKAVPKNRFSVRWTRTLDLTAGTYRFHASCDDGVRIYVDGARIVNAWYDQELPNTRSGDSALSAGPHTIVVEYYENEGGASAHVWWELRSSLTGWEGRYFDNPALSGDPVLIREDADINFNWGSGAPASGVPSDAFSVAWTRHTNFVPGYYRLNVSADGGVRVRVAGALVMDYWLPLGDGSHSRDDIFLTGTQELIVEYAKGAGDARVRFWIDPAGPPLPPPPDNPPVACVGGPLELDAWPLSVERAAGGFIARIYAGARGGDCLYTYLWQGQVKGGPTHTSITFELFTPTMTAIVGRIEVTSGEQTVGRGLFIRAPQD